MRLVIAWVKFLVGFAVAWLVICFIVVGLMVSTTPSGTSPTPAWTFAILFLPVIGAFFVGRRAARADFQAIRALRDANAQERFMSNQAARDADRWRAREFLHEQVDRHRAALQRNVRNALVKNDYGVITSDKRRDAVIEFLASISFPPSALSVDEAISEVLADLEGSRQQREMDGFDPTRVPVDGHEFEHWVADALRKFGWETSVTSAAGDQGIDVVASRNGLKVGIQCKLYSQSVGNRAIQEALAGARYHGLHRAVVLSNAPFTKSAIDLAAAADVLLISQYDLPDLERLLQAMHVPGPR